MLSPTRRFTGLCRLGALRRRAGDLTGAEDAYRRALVVAERHLPGDDLRAARLRNDLGVVLKYTGAFDEAAALYTHVHTVFVARLGPVHPDVGMVLHNIGGLAHARGRPADGETAARAAVSIRSAALGDDHPTSATDRSALRRSLMPPAATTMPSSYSSTRSRSSSADSAASTMKSA